MYGKRKIKEEHPCQPDVKKPRVLEKPLLEPYGPLNDKTDAKRGYIAFITVSNYLVFMHFYIYITHSDVQKMHFGRYNRIPDNKGWTKNGKTGSDRV